MTQVQVESAVDLSPDVALDLHRQSLSQARRSAIVRTAIVAVTLPLFIMLAVADRASAVVLGGVMVPVLLAAGVSIRAYRRLRRADPLQAFRQEVEENASLEQFRRDHEIRLAGTRPWMSYGIGASLVVVFFAENEAGSLQRVVERVGFMKAAVLGGEWWRLVTSACVHAFPMHLIGNLSVLVALGGLVEAYDRRMRVPIVYLASAIGGGLASLALTDKNGLGASGAIMGLAGYLLVRGVAGQLPGRLVERIGVLVAGTAFIGVIGYQFIGNAAHAGGALAGASVAWMTRGSSPSDPDPVGDAVGWASVAALAIATLYTGVRLLE